MEESTITKRKKASESNDDAIAYEPEDNYLHANDYNDNNNNNNLNNRHQSIDDLTNDVLSDKDVFITDEGKKSEYGKFVGGLLNCATVLGIKRRNRSPCLFSSCCCIYSFMHCQLLLIQAIQMKLSILLPSIHQHPLSSIQSLSTSLRIN